LEKMTARFLPYCRESRDRPHTDRYVAEEPPGDDPPLRNKTNSASNEDLVKHLTSEPSAQFEPGNKGDLMFLAIIHHIVPFTIGEAEPVL
jgi:hypothetical protein